MVGKGNEGGEGNAKNEEGAERQVEVEGADPWPASSHRGAVGFAIGADWVGAVGPAAAASEPDQGKQEDVDGAGVRAAGGAAGVPAVWEEEVRIRGQGSGIRG